MGRALLIICGGLLIGLSYTYFGMNSQSMSMTERNVNSYKAIKAKNTAHTGVEIAIEKFNDSNKTWTGPETVNYEDAALTISIEEVKTDTIRVTSKSDFEGAKHTVVSTFDVSQNQSLVPHFKSALDLTHELFSFSQSGSSSISGMASHCKQHAPGVSVLSKKSLKKVGQNSNSKTGLKKNSGSNNNETECIEWSYYEEGGYRYCVQRGSKKSGKGKKGGSNHGPKKGISGEPPIAIDQTLSFEKASELIEVLETTNGITHVNGIYKGSLGTPNNPGVFFVDEYAKLSGGIGNGYGIIVVKKGATLDLKGNVKFNGLVLFEDGIKLDGAGTPVINGSVVVGSPSNLPVNIGITGNIHLQYDCDSKKYADLSINKLLNTTLYQELSIYE